MLAARGTHCSWYVPSLGLVGCAFPSTIITGLKPLWLWLHSKDSLGLVGCAFLSTIITGLKPLSLWLHPKDDGTTSWYSIAPSESSIEQALVQGHYDFYIADNFFTTLFTILKECTGFTHVSLLYLSSSSSSPSECSAQRQVFHRKPRHQGGSFTREYVR